MLYLIGEIGINANGSVDIAKQMIRAAKDAGFDAVKFQKRTVDKVYSKELLDSPRESPWGKTQRAQKNGLEFSYSQYQEIDSYCSEQGIQWSASAWDMASQEFIFSFDPPWNKVASAMLGNLQLLIKIALEGKKTYISTGMSELSELDEVVNVFERTHCPFELMHCNSTYPMRDEDANLAVIPVLRRRYGCNVGYSGHESSLIKVCVTAVALGATSLERHITLDRAMYGSDQAASIETHHLRDFVEAVRAVPLIIGDGVKRITESEKQIRAKLRA